MNLIEELTAMHDQAVNAVKTYEARASKASTSAARITDQEISIRHDAQARAFAAALDIVKAHISKGKSFWAARDRNGEIYLFEDSPKWNDGAGAWFAIHKALPSPSKNCLSLETANFPEIAPGECKEFRVVEG